MTDPNQSIKATTTEAGVAAGATEDLAGAGGKTFLGHPPGLYLLFVTEMWERFSYYGMRAILVLYLVQSITGDPEKNGFNPGRGWSKAEASVLYGWYTGLAYLLPIVGGLLADKFIGTHRSMLVGGVIIALGHLALAVSGLGELAHNPLGMSIFIFGLALIVIGTGHFKPTVSVMVGQLYPAKDPRRDGAFTIFYMGINLGAFLCAFVVGTLGEKVGWHWGFGSAAVGMLAGLAVYMIGKPRLLRGIGSPPQGKPNIAPLLFLTAIVASAAVAVFFHMGGFRQIKQAMSALMEIPYAPILVPAILIGLVLAWSVWFVQKQEPGDKGPTAGILIFLLFNAFFWIAFEQAGTSLNLFAMENTDRHILGWEMPASWFQSVNPALIFLLAPAFAAMWSALSRRNRNPSQSVKIALGLLILGGGYIFMVVGGSIAADGVKVGMIWLLATYTLHTIGELCLSPTGLSFVTKAAPVRYVSFLMGIWFLSSFVANLGGGLVASTVERIEKGEMSLPWYPWFRLGGQADFYLLFVISSVGAGIIILALTPLLKKMLHGRG